MALGRQSSPAGAAAETAAGRAPQPTERSPPSLRGPADATRLPPDACPSIETCNDEACCYLDWLIDHAEPRDGGR